MPSCGMDVPVLYTSGFDVTCFSTKITGALHLLLRNRGFEELIN